jgi:type IV secretory pathway TraG/TraD family ATPase VirD4
MTAAALLLNLLRMRCLERFGINQRPMMWILDEAPKYAARIQLDQLLDVIRGANVAVVVGLQDVTQFGHEDERKRMLANCQMLIALKGLAPESASYVSSRMGTRMTPVTSHQMDRSGFMTPSVRHEALPILGDRELMFPPVGHFGAVVHSPELSPAPLLVTFDQ